jgi:hypothetical protein
MDARPIARRKTPADGAYPRWAAGAAFVASLLVVGAGIVGLLTYFYVSWGFSDDLCSWEATPCLPTTGERIAVSSVLIGGVAALTACLAAAAGGFRYCLRPSMAAWRTFTRLFTVAVVLPVAVVVWLFVLTALGAMFGFDVDGTPNPIDNWPQ